MNSGPLSDGERVEAERRHQSAQPCALREVVVHDDAVGQAEARRHRDQSRPGEKALTTERDHMFGHEPGSGRRASHGHTPPAGVANRSGDRGSADNHGQPQLIAARHEDTVGLRERLQPVLTLAVLPHIERQGSSRLHPDAAENLFILRAGILELGSRRDDGNARLVATAKVDEARENAGIPDLLFGASDGDDEPFASAVSGSRGAQVALDDLT